MTNLRKILVFSVFLLPLNLSAGDIHFSGFATLSGGILFDDSRKDGKKTTYEGYDDQLGFNSKSLMGLQASSDLDNGWGVTTQFIARSAESWDLSTEWAFLSYDATDNWRLLFGRQRAPLYMYSAFLDVSYAYHWITPPSGVYSLPFDVIDGVGSIYESTIGDIDSTVHVTFGRNRDPAILINEERTTDFSDFLSASWTLHYDWLTFRASYARTNLSIELAEFTPLFEGFRTAQFPDVADRLEMKDDFADFAGIGFTVDYDDYLLVSEYTKIHTGDNFFPEQDSYYISFGKRFDLILLHLTYGADENKANFSILDNVPVGVNPGLDGLLAGAKTALSAVQEDSTFYTLGLRWEVNDSIAWKVEYTKFTDDDKVDGLDASLFQTALTTVF